MKMAFFQVSALAGEDGAAELNRFLATHRIASLDRHFVAAGDSSFWAVAVTTVGQEVPRVDSRRVRVDYKSILSGPDFEVFAQLRALRKELAEKEGVPLYALFTNEQLAEMVRLRVGSKESLGNIAGVGKGRVEKYGEAFLDRLKQCFRAGSHSEPSPGTARSGDGDSDGDGEMES